MSTTVTPLHPGNDDFWPTWGLWYARLRDTIEADRTTMEDLLEALWEGRAQLWADSAAIVVTEIAIYPRTKILRCWLACGEYPGIRRIERAAIPWARDHGCTQLEIVGRLGWRRRLRDYRERAVVMSREI